MSKKLIAIFMIVPLLGCTTPSQPIASKALSEGINQAHSVFYDMSRIARQEVLNAGAEAVAQAAEAQDPVAAQMVLKSVFDKMNKIDWLHVQWERSRAFVRIGQSFVWGQKGLFDILIKEWDKAKENYDKKKAEEPSE